jgi:hypothetical protein
VGRRPALIRELKMLLMEYLADPLYQPAGFPSIRALNQGIISSFYNMEADLLYLELGSNANLYNQYNNGDCCAALSSYSSYSLFNETMSAT